jgi:hypothetical protein
VALTDSGRPFADSGQPGSSRFRSLQWRPKRSATRMGPGERKDEMRRILVTLAALAMASVGAVAAGADQLSGTFSHSAVEDGVPAYFKLVGPDEACTDPGPGQYAGQASFSKGEAAYTLEGVAAGKYMGCFFIDTDDNVMETQGPTSGDFGSMKPVTVDGDTTLDVTEAEWGQIP